MGFQTNMIWMLLAAICVVAFIELAADYFLKKWSSNHRHWWYLVAGMAVYALVGCSYGLSLLMGDLTIANSIWQVLSVVSVTILGVFVFHEKPTLGQWGGIGVIILGLIVLLLGSQDVLPSVWGGTAFHRPWTPVSDS